MLILDADMLFRKALTPGLLRAEPGECSCIATPLGCQTACNFLPLHVGLACA